MYLFIDTETTGLSRSSDHVVQVAWILTDEAGNVEFEECHVIRPDGYSIPWGAAQIHGITTAIAEDIGKSAEWVLQQLSLSVAKASVVVAHNLSFDLGILHHDYKRAGLRFPFHGKAQICTMKLSTSWCRLPKFNGSPGFKYPTLGELYYRLFGEVFDNPHDALADTQACTRSYFELVELGVIDSPKVLVPRTPTPDTSVALRQQQPQAAVSSVRPKSSFATDNHPREQPRRARTEAIRQQREAEERGRRGAEEERRRKESVLDTRRQAIVARYEPLLAAVLPTTTFLAYFAAIFITLMTALVLFFPKMKDGAMLMLSTIGTLIITPIAKEYFRKRAKESSRYKSILARRDAELQAVGDQDLPVVALEPSRPKAKSMNEPSPMVLHPSVKPYLPERVMPVAIGIEEHVATSNAKILEKLKQPQNVASSDDIQHASTFVLQRDAAITDLVETPSAHGVTPASADSNVEGIHTRQLRVRAIEPKVSNDEASTMSVTSISMTQDIQGLSTPITSDSEKEPEDPAVSNAATAPVRPSSTTRIRQGPHLWVRGYQAKATAERRETGTRGSNDSAAVHSEAQRQQLETEKNRLMEKTKQIVEELPDELDKQCIKLVGKKLIDMARNKHTYATLILIPSGKIRAKARMDQSGYETLCMEIDAELDDLEFGHSRRSVRVGEDVRDLDRKLQSTAKSYAPLTDDELNIVKGISSQIESLALYSIWWGFGNVEPQFHRLVEWVSDVDGQYVTNSIFSKIKLQKKRNIPRLEFAVHQGYFVTEEGHSIDVWEMDKDDVDECEFVADDEEDVFYEHKIVPLAAETARLFFAMFEYRINFSCNNPKKGIHRVTIEW